MDSEGNLEAPGWADAPGMIRSTAEDAGVTLVKLRCKGREVQSVRYVVRGSAEEIALFERRLRSSIDASGEW